MKLGQWIGLGILIGLAAACVQPSQVVQGTVSNYQADAKTLVVKDEKPPHAELTLSLESAEIGAEPSAGDVVRVAYRDQQGKLTALRVMNLTRQKELTGSGGH